ncbi:hypothetical protein ACIPLR_15880 [Herbaspirillum huttiense]|uniref:hypothetical protein n=1 Tax=Herbaspirillum huttiense TaxID=863372 RepID=UPI0037FA693D
MRPEKLPAESVPEKFYAVLNSSATEGVLFKDKADADFTATGEHESWGTPTIGEAFRNSYAEDGSMTVREVLLSSPAVAQHSDDAAVDRFATALKEKLALAREKGRSGWEQCDAADLSYMLREHVEKGDPRDVANFCMFLWSLGEPIGDARPVVDLQLTMLDGIQVWIDAYTNAANGPHFMDHGRIVQLLREYLALRKLLAQRNPPPLPETHFNGCGDGSEPLYTADMMRLYAMQHTASIALPAAPAPVMTDDERRLVWISQVWGSQHADYASHLLSTGGDGDVGDIRAYIDKQMGPISAL